MNAANGTLWVLLLSGTLGFRVGMLGFPEWQVAVETAQVVAGVVRYPAPTPFYIYHSQLWTVLHHVLAIPLKAGVSEFTLSLIVSGVLGMLTFQALSMFVYALGRSVPLAVGGAALIVFTRAAEYGTVYPIFLLGTVHTYGAIGLSAAVLTVALLGAGWYRTGALLLGVLPCIHASLGMWTWLVIAAAVVSDFRNLRAELRRALPWFLAGCGVTLASLIFHFAFVYDTAPVSAAWSPDELSVYVRLWDSHRRTIDFREVGVRLNAASIIVASLWLALFRRDLPHSAKLLLRIVVASAVLGLAAVPLSHIAPERLPRSLVVLMPGRWLNFVAMTYVAMIAGLLASRREFWSRCVLLFLLAGLLLSSRSMLWEFVERHHHIRYDSGVRPMQVVWLATAALIAGASWTRWKAPAEAGRSRWHLVVTAPAVALVPMTVLMLLHQHAQHAGDYFQDRTNDVFFSEVGAGQGVLLVAGDLYLVQLRTRRPLLVDAGAIDTVMYSMSTGAEMHRILRDVYGLDLFHPPPDAIGAGRIPLSAHRKIWESYSVEKWRAIRRDFGVTQVLAYSDWALQLPLASQSRRLLLYDIPER